MPATRIIGILPPETIENHWENVVFGWSECPCRKKTVKMTVKGKYAETIGRSWFSCGSECPCRSGVFGGTGIGSDCVFMFTSLLSMFYLMVAFLYHRRERLRCACQNGPCRKEEQAILVGTSHFSLALGMLYVFVSTRGIASPHPL